MKLHRQLLSLFLLLVSLLFTGVLSSVDGPLVETKYGQLRGTYLSIPDHDKQAVSFLGVPYVAPPVGDLRFQSPQPLEPWEGIKDATEYGAPCPQMLAFANNVLKEDMGLVMMEPQPPSEDCLTLDIYSPSLTSRRPVMLFIHGGGLTTGWSAVYDFRSYAIVEDIVAVSIQYRLGALGWLSTGDGVVEGNMGFKDQVAALRWVQENIAQFGGDPDQVTIFGESAGAMSVTMHLLSHASSGLFHRAIVQSGSIVDSAFFDPPVPSKASALGLAESLGCPLQNMGLLVECLREQPADLLVDPTKSDKFDGSALSLNYVPTLDNACFPELPETLLQKGTFNTGVDVMLGLTNVEGYMLAKIINPRVTEPDFNLEDFRTTIFGHIAVSYPDSPPEVQDALIDAALRLYSRAPEGNQLHRDYADWVGDSVLSLPTYKMAVGLAGQSKGKTFFYELRHRPLQSNRPDYIISDHGDDLLFMSGCHYTGKLSGTDVKYSDDDKKVAKIMMKYWTNFGRSGNPNGDNLPKWPEFSGAYGPYLVLKPQPVVEHNYKGGQMGFWTEIAPAMVAKERSKASAVPGDGPVVEIKQGKLKGKLVTLKDGDKSAFAFLNIPFTAPPVGDLRFQLPQPAKSWEGVRDATKYGMPCPQPKDALGKVIREELGIDIKPLEATSEDCLHLNIYTPDLSGRKPVMVFIHGGGFTVGWASSYDMRTYAILHDIVGVVIQYRLGPLGFLNSGDDVVPRNLAFKDQIAALQWVQENIAQFGGDPNQVTIFGESAGSFSVSMHLLSAPSRGLFHHAILHSGSVLDSSFFSPPQPAAAMMVKLANAIGCPNISSEAMVECMRTKPADLLVNPYGTDVLGLGPETFLWTLSVDDGYVPELPATMFNNGDFNKDVDVIAGFCNVEGYMLIKSIVPGFPAPGFNVSQFEATALGLLGMLFPGYENLAKMAEAATNVYVKDPEEEDANSALVHFAGDYLITFQTLKTAEKVSEKSNRKVFMYEFRERPPFSKRPDFISADHGDDLLFTFGYSYIGEFDGVPLDVPDKKSVRKVEDPMMAYWANFARTGDPNGAGLLKWSQVNDNKAYMVLTKDLHVEHDYESERMNFWFKTIPDLAKSKEERKDEL